MSYPINYPTPQGANVQIFTGYGAGGSNINTGFDWVKPQGASFVWFTLIGPGGNGNGSSGGGSGAVTNFMCPAFLIPNMLSVYPGTVSNDATTVKYREKTGTGYILLSANHASGASAASAMTANAFTAMGFFQSVAGQAGDTVPRTASSTTFLSGGGAASTTTANYGYTTSTNGYFQMNPIIVGVGGAGAGSGGIGCGSGLSNTTGGGNGMVVIITW